MNTDRLQPWGRAALALAALAALPAVLVALVAGVAPAQDKTVPAVKVTVKDETPVIEEVVLPVDPQRRINYQPTGLSVQIRSEQNQTLHLSHFPIVHLNDQVYQVFQGNGFGKVEYENRPLPKPKSGQKQQEGFASSYIIGDGLRLTMTATLVPGKNPPDGAKKRQMDTMLIHYTVENTSQKAQKFGLKIYMDTYIINNDGCLFAAPTMPGKILDGVVLKGKELPAYVQLLQQPDLKNPGYVAHLTLDISSKFEKPDRVVLSRHGAGGFGGWDFPAMQAGGDSALAIFWDPKEIKPGAKREMVYGYGRSIASSPENEGKVEVALGGSFEPGKVFAVTAYVSDPSPGQSLSLELPAGMELVEGKLKQSVPELREGEVTSVVFWRARVLKTGEFAVRVRSSTGVTQGKLISIAAAKE
jgi:hypothetical protein